MPPFSQYQSVFRISKNTDANNTPESRTSKRNRQPVSCSACRTRKLKCDRQIPCSSCLKKGEPVVCTYPIEAFRHRSTRDDTPRASEAQLRLQRLEEMVTTLMESNKSASPTPSDKLSIRALTTPNWNSSPGHQDVNGSEATYLGATHWESILENIRDIQGVLGPESGDPLDAEEIPLSSSATEEDIVLGGSQASSDTLFNSLPPRNETDKLLSIYFNSSRFQIPIIHRAKFQREYEAFWVNHSSRSLLWLSMLFSILHIASRLKQQNGEIILSPPPKTHSFLALAGQSLASGRYQKALPYSLEALLLYTMCKVLFSEDLDADAWILIGIAARLAIRMGYHRDPSHFPNISPFTGEMRRRVFFVVEIFDVLLSSIVGLPAVIQEDDCDTEFPRNLLDTDFDENCTALPISRPPTDPTPMLYYCYKSRLGKSFRRVTRHALSLKGSTCEQYEDTLKLDAELHEVHSDIPPSLKMKPLRQSYTDSLDIIQGRLNTNVMYQEALCILHRKALTHERANPQFDYCRKTCLGAALELLENQAELHFAIQPGGQFHNQWLMSTSLSLHGYLLAAMVICLDLYESHKEAASLSVEQVKIQMRNYDALKLSHEIWVSRSATSRDARRASKILATMLARVPRPSYPFRHTVLEIDVQESSSASQDILNNDLPSSKTSSLNTSSFSDLQIQPMDYNISDVSVMDPFSAAFSTSDGIDWGLVDQYLLGLDGTSTGEMSFDWQPLDISPESAS